jgi:PEP-CTERM motif
MRIKILASKLLAAASATLLIPAANAALVYTNGDLFLGVRASSNLGATQDYLVDLGPASQFTTTAAFTLSLNGSNLGADLVSLFGANWNTRLDVFWSVSGTNLPGDPSNTLYATRARSDVLTPALAWNGRSNSAQGTTNSLFNQLAGQYAANGTATGNSSVATFQNTSDPNSYASFQPGGVNSSGISFKAFSPSIEGSFANGTSGSVIDLFRVIPDTVLPVGDLPGERLGSFKVDDNGALSFTGAVVPEPTSFMLLGSGSALLGLLRRRQPVVAWPIEGTSNN